MLQITPVGTTRIEIEGQYRGQGCFQAGGSLRMQETMPAFLQPYMSAQDWQHFHEEMRTVLEPLSAWKRKQGTANTLFFLLFIACFIGFAISGFANVRPTTIERVPLCSGCVSQRVICRSCAGQ